MLGVFKEWTTYLAGGIETAAALLVAVAALEALLHAFLCSSGMPTLATRKKRPCASG